ncbi:hypothetical protein Tco_1407659 [Tanacetum coccineum]
MLEVVTALAAEEAHSTSPHSRAASSPRDAQGTANSQGTAEVQGTDNSQGTAEVQGTACFHVRFETHGFCLIFQNLRNDYTSTMLSKTSGGDEGLLDLYALNREVRRLKKQTLSQAKLIRKLKAKLKTLSKVVEPVVKHHAFWVESQHLKKQKRRRKKQKKKVSSVKLGRNKEEGTLSEEHYVQDDYTQSFLRRSFYNILVLLPDMERKSDGTGEINIESKRLLLLKLMKFLPDISRPRGLSIPLSHTLSTSTQQPSQATDRKIKQRDPFVEENPKKEINSKTNAESFRLTDEWEGSRKDCQLNGMQRRNKRNYLRIEDFEKNAQDRESQEGMLHEYRELQDLILPRAESKKSLYQESLMDKDARNDMEWKFL